MWPQTPLPCRAGGPAGRPAPAGGETPGEPPPPSGPPQSPAGRCGAQSPGGWKKGKK